MEALQFSFQNILDGQGGGIALTGMSIVFTALGLITLFIALVPRVLEAVARILPETEGYGGRTTPGEPGDDAEVVAAIGFAFHTEMQERAVHP